MTKCAAHARLLDERQWIDAVGVEPAQLCLHWRTPIARPRRFCNVACEAAFIASVV